MGYNSFKGSNCTVISADSASERSFFQCLMLLDPHVSYKMMMMNGRSKSALGSRCGEVQAFHRDQNLEKAIGDAPIKKTCVAKTALDQTGSQENSIAL